MSVAVKISDGLQKIIDDFAVGQDCAEVIIEQEDFTKLVSIFHVLKTLALRLEIEVRMLREMEIERTGQLFLDDEATQQLTALLSDTDDNIIHPNFGGRNET